ncbi:HYD1 signature containing ADP-ribosyltransferase family protein [Cohnella silvisoli]|uniref:HYD1 signature containing ADP-ribosyltransferase family protein n=1 Tax=Cohnella silvisoli TaxID=2873699 RepID=A0ABV1KLX1_9BACL|nr:HYD1 signature containing ADP-ribosyltransferase family protein [Cohnella silvisoli]MCD9020574.1 hypothetical protein [Cohnella silvisoli]
MHHYTTANGLQSILKTQKILPSLRAANPNDARYGDGQYFTDIIPNTKTVTEISHALVGNPFQGNKFTHYISLNLTGLPVVLGRKNVFVLLNTAPLNISGRILNYGQVTKTK